MNVRDKINALVILADGDAAAAPDMIEAAVELALSALGVLNFLAGEIYLLSLRVDALDGTAQPESVRVSGPVEGIDIDAQLLELRARVAAMTKVINKLEKGR